MERILSELGFSPETETALRGKLRKSERALGEISETAYQGEAPDFPICRRAPLTRLAAVCRLLLQKYGEYRALGVSDEIIFDTFGDVSLRAELYLRKTGKAGLSREDAVWFRHIMKAEIFKIGVLQYQPFEMLYLDEETLGEPYMVFSPEQKARLPAGAPVLNCHLQRGAQLSGESAGRSLKAAEAFFRKLRPEVKYRAFLCYSWLLYPPMTASLSPRSNIRRFAERFSVVGSCGDREQAAENLFDGGARPTAPTSLQALYAAQPERFGFACGLIPIE